jgi:hypothetical protein
MSYLLVVEAEQSVFLLSVTHFRRSTSERTRPGVVRGLEMPAKAPPRLVKSPFG